MELKHCLVINAEARAELDNALLVLKTSKSIMALTMPTPDIDWVNYGLSIYISGGSDELNVISQSLRVSLGLFADDSIGFTETGYTVPVKRTATQTGDGLSTTQVNRVTGDPVPFASEIPFDQGSTRTRRVLDTANNFWHDEDEWVDWTEDEIEHIEQTHEEMNNNARIALHHAAWGVGDFDSETECSCRMMDAAMDDLVNADRYRDNEFVDSDLRAEWQVIYDRLHDEPRPTASASGSYTIEEQAAYSEAANPRHWNLVKTRFDGRTSGFYLSYICPPYVNMEHQLRIIGGPNRFRTPVQFEICVYNTESYWRELRHMMHQEVSYLREAVAA